MYAEVPMGDDCYKILESGRGGGRGDTAKPVHFRYLFALPYSGVCGQT